MKKILILLPLGAVAASVLLAGCSKSKTAGAPPGGTSNDSATAETANSPADLTIKWTPGKTYAMRMEFNQGTEMKVPNQPDPVKQEVKLTQGFDLSPVKKLDNGGWQLGLRFETESMDVTAAGRSVMSFDSTASPTPDTNNPVAPFMRAMIGARLEYFTDAAGKVTKMEGLDDLMKRIDAAGKPQQRVAFQQMFSEDTLKRYGAVSEALPNRSVNIGESWSVKDDIASPIGTLALDMKYTFKNWEQHNDHRCAHVASAGDISSKSTSAAMVGAVIEIQSGKIVGEYWFDPEPGMIVDAHDTQDITLKITTRAETMKQQLNQQVRVSLVDVQ